MTEISLIAAFISGMVALFAPCCISYLFPAYMGNIFKEKRWVLLMTFIYSLGIFVVMMPIVLGASFLSKFFMRFHDYTYIVGGSVMILVSFVTLLGLKMPMPNFSYSPKQNKEGKPDVVSTFTLGIFSGITSACCAPVLIGVMTLSSLSFSVFNSLLIGFTYVLGMVTPLYIASIFIEKNNFLEKPILKKKLKVVEIGGNQYPIFVSNVVGFLIFFLTGVIIMVMSSLGMLSMDPEEMGVAKQIANFALQVTNFTGKIPFVNLIFGGGVVFAIYKFTEQVRDEFNEGAKRGGAGKEKSTGKNKKGDCCH